MAVGENIKQIKLGNDVHELLSKYRRFPHERRGSRRNPYKSPGYLWDSGPPQARYIHLQPTAAYPAVRQGWQD